MVLEILFVKLLQLQLLQHDTHLDTSPGYKPYPLTFSANGLLYANDLALAQVYKRAYKPSFHWVAQVLAYVTQDLHKQTSLLAWVGQVYQCD